MEDVPRVEAQARADHEPHRHAVEDETDDELDEAAGHGAGEHDDDSATEVVFSSRATCATLAR